MVRCYYRVGLFAVTPHLDWRTNRPGQGYRVTHVPSGSHAGEFDDLPSARTFARAMQREAAATPQIFGADSLSKLLRHFTTRDGQRRKARLVGLRASLGGR
jgi:hypothetical protein